MPRRRLERPGIFLNNASNGRVTGNTASYSYIGIYSSGWPSVSTDSIQIDRNTVSHISQTGIQVDNGASNITVQYNSVSKTGLTAGGWAGIYGASSGAGNAIRYNTSFSNGTSSTMGAGYEIDIGSAPTQLYDNIAYSNTAGCIQVASSGHLIYNNTCYNNNTQSIDLGELNFFGGASSVTVENNILVASSGQSAIVAYSGSTTGHTLNYNVFYGGGASPFNWDGTSYSFSQYQRATDQDVHSLNSDPLSFLNPSTSQFWLQATSPAIGAEPYLERVQYRPLTGKFLAKFGLNWRSKQLRNWMGHSRLHI